MNGNSDLIGLTYQYATVAGHRTRYLVGGKGPSLVFLHGWGLANRTYYRGVVAVGP